MLSIQTRVKPETIANLYLFFTQSGTNISTKSQLIRYSLELLEQNIIHKLQKGAIAKKDVGRVLSYLDTTTNASYTDLAIPNLEEDSIPEEDEYTRLAKKLLSERD